MDKLENICREFGESDKEEFDRFEGTFKNLGYQFFIVVQPIEGSLKAPVWAIPDRDELIKVCLELTSDGWFYAVHSLGSGDIDLQKIILN